MLLSEKPSKLKGESAFLHFTTAVSIADVFCKKKPTKEPWLSKLKALNYQIICKASDFAYQDNDNQQCY